MKWIVYRLNIPRNAGTEDAPLWEDQLFEKRIPYCEDNLPVAQEEAHRGEYTVEDDGMPEVMTERQRIIQLEEALELLLSGVTQ